MCESSASVATPRHALIVGLGATGLAAARWLQRDRLRIRVVDSRVAPPQLEAARAALGDEAEIRLAMPQFTADLLDDHVDLVVLSPGLSPASPALMPLLAAARERGLDVVGEVELFARALARLADTHDYHPRLLGVTGTNGKTTVTAATAYLLNECGVSASAAGNIGPAVLQALNDAIEAGTLPDVWVLELSSFQLETVDSLSLHAAVVLNLSEDHLDWHGDMTAYAAAKARILSMARQRIVNRDDAVVRTMVAGLTEPTVRSFGSDLPELAGDLGVDHTSGLAWLVAATEPGFGAEPPPRRRKGQPEPGRDTGAVNRLMPVDALLLRGAHNWLNIQAALLLARSLDLPWAGLLRTVRHYRGEPHRMTWLRSVGGIDFIDDSKGTNVGATLAALRGLDRRVVLIAGGDGKGQDFRPLVPAVGSHARAVVLIGKDAAQLAAALEPSGVPLSYADSMVSAVTQAAGLAEPGDVVLLSPACASLDMFEDYRHRARVFTDAVEDLALERGEV